MNRLIELTDKINDIIKRDDFGGNPQIVSEIKDYVPKMGAVGIAQIDLSAGDVKSNSKKIMKYIKSASMIGLDVVIFPELSTIGFPIGDVLKRYPIIVDENKTYLKEIALNTRNVAAIVGFADNKEGKICQSAAFISDGKIQKIINGFDIININGIKYGVLVGDMLKSDNIIPKEGFDVLAVCSSVPNNVEKEQKMNHILSDKAKTLNIPVVYVNQSGAMDDIVFCGISKVFNKHGRLTARAKSFDEQFLITNPLNEVGCIYPIEESFDGHSYNKNEFSLDYEFDLERTYNSIIKGVRGYFQKNGFKRACLGLSGGLDSSVCAVIMADAIGKENVYGISMPSKITSNESRSDAELLASNLGINYTEIPIKEPVTAISGVFENMFDNIESNWDCRYKKSFTNDNIQARTRATYLWGISNEFDSCIPIATSDKSEAYMGYATINGDMSGGFAPIADVTKTKLFALARWLNKNRTDKNAIPMSVINKRPGAELAIDERTGEPLKAEDALMPYEFLDEIIWRIENKNEGYNKKNLDFFL